MSQSMSLSVIHITRSKSPTSMPWNDLHKSISTAKIMQSEFVVVHKIFGFSLKLGDKSGYEYFQTGVFSLFNTIRQIRNRNERSNTVLHCHNASLFALSLIISFILGTKIVFNIHNDWLNFNYFQKLNIYIVGFFSKRFICVSNAVKDSIPIRKKIFDINLFDFIDNSIDSDFFNKAYPLKDHEVIRQKKIVIIARMVPQKNVKLLLEIISKLDKSWTVDWFGDGPEKKIILSYLDQNNISCIVNICGIVSREKVFIELYDSMIYLACSHWEGIGVANLEAGALGCVPILSNIPPHINIAENTGAIICDNNSLDTWMSAIEYISKDLVSYSTLSRGICLSTRKKYDRNEMIHKYLDIYKAL